LNGLLDPAFLLRLNHEYLSFAILVQHFQHEVVELNHIIEELLVVLRWIIHFEGHARNHTQVLVEDVCL